MAQDAAAADSKTLKLTAAEVAAFLDEVFPERHQGWPPVHIEHLAPYTARLRMEFRPNILRPGGTISGPAIFKLADFGLYVAVLGMIGRVPLAVTTSLTINFLRRPLPRDLIAEVRLLKLGKRLAVGEAHLYSDGQDAPVAQASGTYAIPPPE